MYSGGLRDVMVCGMYPGGMCDVLVCVMCWQVRCTPGVCVIFWYARCTPGVWTWNGRLGPKMSASNSPTLPPSAASANDKLHDTVDLPTPPLQLMNRRLWCGYHDNKRMCVRRGRYEKWECMTFRLLKKQCWPCHCDYFGDILQRRRNVSMPWFRLC